ncbi:zinc ribbon domain-containing protein [Shimia thalassica]|uniref:zinc ribbon domain-containing protein n=1 Tax=Shimia thalassica TaxID=1715693 RepID=UPI00349F936D
MNCPYCDTDLSPTAITCPHCGHDLLSDDNATAQPHFPPSPPPPPVTHTLWLIVAFIGILLIFFMF